MQDVNAELAKLRRQAENLRREQELHRELRGVLHREQELLHRELEMHRELQQVEDKAAALEARPISTATRGGDLSGMQRALGTDRVRIESGSHLHHMPTDM